MSDKPTIVFAFDPLETAESLFENDFNIVRPPKGRDFTKEELIDLLPECDALCSVFDIPVDCEMIEAGGRRLKLIANYAVGFNNIDIDYARQKGIAVSNTPKTVVTPTAELVMALLLSATRRIVELDAAMRTEKALLKISRMDYLGVDLAGKSIGIIGFGNIGQAVARRCNAFDMKVLYNKRTPLSAVEEQKQLVSYASIDDIFSVCDIISLHTPLTDATYHLVNRERLSRMKPSAILINTARGAVVDEAALVEALENRAIAGAALDVFENKDKPDPRLYGLGNVVMTPHIGTQTNDGRMAMFRELLDNLVGFFFHEGEGVAFVVDPRTK